MRKWLQGLGVRGPAAANSNRRTGVENTSGERCHDTSTPSSERVDATWLRARAGLAAIWPRLRRHVSPCPRYLVAPVDAAGWALSNVTAIGGPSGRHSVRCCPGRAPAMARPIG